MQTKYRRPRAKNSLQRIVYTVVHPSHVHPRWYKAWNLTRASHARELAKRRPLLRPAYVRSETAYVLFYFFTCSLIYTNTIRFEKLCTRNTCVLMSWFHSHTRFQVSSIITCQFRTDVQNFFGRILSNSSHSVEVLKNPLTSMFNLMFLTTFVLKLFHFGRRIRIHLVLNFVVRTM